MKQDFPIMEPMCSAFQEDVKCYEEGVDLCWVIPCWWPMCGKGRRLQKGIPA